MNLLKPPYGAFSLSQKLRKVSSLVNDITPITTPASTSRIHDTNMKIPTFTLQHQCLALQAITVARIDEKTASKEPMIRMMNIMFLYFSSTLKFSKEKLN